MRRALAGPNAGMPVSVDWTTELDGRSLRRPLSPAACAMRGRRALPISEQSASAQRELDEGRARPLSRSHGDAPAMTLEHLTDQYWFPYFGLLVSEQGQVWRHSFLGPFQDGFLTRVKAVVDRAARPTERASTGSIPSGSTRVPADRRRTSAARRLRPAELRPLPARRGSPDPSRRQDGHADADLDAEAVAAGACRAARRSSRG